MGNNVKLTLARYRFPGLVKVRAGGTSVLRGIVDRSIVHDIVVSHSFYSKCCSRDMFSHFRNALNQSHHQRDYTHLRSQCWVILNPSAPPVMCLLCLGLSDKTRVFNDLTLAFDQHDDYGRPGSGDNPNLAKAMAYVQ